MQIPYAKHAYKLALAASAVILLAAAQNAYADSTTSQLTVNSQLANGTIITGYFTELVPPNSNSTSGFTPATFTVNNGETYNVGVADYLNFFFNYWLDTDSTDRWRSLVPTGDTQLYAIYREGGSTDPVVVAGADTPADPSPRGTNQDYLQELATKLSVYGGDNSKVPDTNLSGHTLPGGSQVTEYHGMYQLISFGMNMSNVMRAADMAGLDWNSLTEMQQCYLALVLNLDLQLDNNGLLL